MVYVTENQQKLSIFDMLLSPRGVPDHRTVSDYRIKADPCELSVSDVTRSKFGQCSAFYHGIGTFVMESNQMWSVQVNNRNNVCLCYLTSVE